MHFTKGCLADTEALSHGSVKNRGQTTHFAGRLTQNQVLALRNRCQTPVFSQTREGARPLLQKESIMKAVVYKDKGKVAVENVPDAKIEAPGDVVVRITTAAICG